MIKLYLHLDNHHGSFRTSYWGINIFKKAIQDPSQEEIKNMSNDAITEMEQTINDDTNNSLRIMNISKIYSSLFSRKKFNALSNMYLRVPKGQCLCLLGHNGAGKTTLVSILTGLFQPSSGNAFIFGKSVKSDMNQIRSILGVCPQHDILFNELSPYQHLQLFAELKGVNLNEIDNALKQVELYDRRFDRCGGFSGGMKRRLSLAISCIGNPSILFLDEPTTGLDPLSKRKYGI